MRRNIPIGSLVDYSAHPDWNGARVIDVSNDYGEPYLAVIHPTNGQRGTIRASAVTNVRAPGATVAPVTPEDPFPIGSVVDYPTAPSWNGSVVTGRSGREYTVVHPRLGPGVMVVSRMVRAGPAVPAAPFSPGDRVRIANRAPYAGQMGVVAPWSALSHGGRLYDEDRRTRQTPVVLDGDSGPMLWNNNEVERI